MRIPPHEFGYDTTSPPNFGGGLRGMLAMHRWLLDNTNLRHAGGYTTSTNVWGTGNSSIPGGLFAQLWSMGFGVSIFDNSTVQDGSRGSPRKGAGETDAAAVRDRANTNAPSFARAVVYVDNEDNNAQTFANLVQYYRELFGWLERQPPDQVRIRPGLYAKSWVAKALLAEFPYLYLCDVQYPCHQPLPQCWDVPSSRNPYNTSDPYSMVRGTGGSITFQPGGPNALPASLSDSAGRPLPPAASGRGPKRPWFAWPTVFQFEGTNRAPLATGTQTAVVAGTPEAFSFQRSWAWSVDCESALVDDPAYPSVSPRLALSQGPPVLMARVDRVAPPVDQTRQGRRTISQMVPAGVGPMLTENPSASGNPAPGGRPAWIQAASDLLLVTPRLIGFELILETHRLERNILKPVAMAISDPPTGLLFPVHSPWGVTAPTLKEAFLFTVANDGSLVASRGAPSSTSVWPSVVHSSKSVHQYSQLAVTHRGDQSVDVFYIGADRALHTAWWNSSLAWPSRTDQPIGSPDALLPTTNLAAMSPDQNTLLVFGIGYDLRLQLAVWTNPGPWVGPAAVGRDDELLAAHTDLAVVWNPRQNVCEVIAVGNDLTLCLYQVARNPGGWTTSKPRSILFTAPVGANRLASTAPNPFGDLGLAIAGNQRIAVAVFSDNAGALARSASTDTAGSGSGATWADLPAPP